MSSRVRDKKRVLDSSVRPFPRRVTVTSVTAPTTTSRPRFERAATQASGDRVGNQDSLQRGLRHS
jgi:hypothetical protein